MGRHANSTTESSEGKGAKVQQLTQAKVPKFEGSAKEDVKAAKNTTNASVNKEAKTAKDAAETAKSSGKQANGHDAKHSSSRDAKANGDNYACPNNNNRDHRSIDAHSGPVVLPNLIKGSRR